MGKTILIAGKNMPDAGNFTEGIALSGRNIIVTGLQTEYEGKKLTIAERKQNQANYEEESIKYFKKKNSLKPRLEFVQSNGTRLLHFQPDHWFCRQQQSTPTLTRQSFTLMKNGTHQKQTKWTQKKLHVQAMKCLWGTSILP